MSDYTNMALSCLQNGEVDSALVYAVVAVADELARKPVSPAQVAQSFGATEEKQYVRGASEPGDLLTEKQGKAIYAITRSKGFNQLEYVSGVLQRTVTDTRKLTKQEAGIVLDRLHAG